MVRDIKNWFKKPKKDSFEDSYYSFLLQREKCQNEFQQDSEDRVFDRKLDTIAFQRFTNWRDAEPIIVGDKSYNGVGMWLIPPVRYTIYDVDTAKYKSPFDYRDEIVKRFIKLKIDHEKSNG